MFRKFGHPTPDFDECFAKLRLRACSAGARLRACSAGAGSGFSMRPTPVASGFPQDVLRRSGIEPPNRSHTMPGGPRHRPMEPNGQRTPCTHTHTRNTQTHGHNTSTHACMHACMCTRTHTHTLRVGLGLGQGLGSGLWGRRHWPKAIKFRWCSSTASWISAQGGHGPGASLEVAGSA